MAAIVQYSSFLSPYDPDPSNAGLTLFNEDYIRPLPFGNDWQRLRIGVCMTVDHPPSQLYSGGLVDIGVCSGQRGINTLSPVNYIGVGWGSTGASKFTATLVPRLEYKTDLTGNWPCSGFGLSDAASQYALSQYGSTQTDFVWSRTQGGVTMYVPVTAPYNTTRRRGFLVVDFIRVSQTIFRAYLYYDSNNGYCDVPRSSMVAAMESPLTGAAALPDIPAWNFQTNAMISLSLANRIATLGTNITYLNSAGPLDSLNIAWNLDSFGLTIYHIMVAKFG